MEAQATPRRPRRGIVLVVLAVLVLVMLLLSVLMWWWDSEPRLFDPVQVTQIQMKDM